MENLTNVTIKTLKDATFELGRISTNLQGCINATQDNRLEDISYYTPRHLAVRLINLARSLAEANKQPVVVIKPDLLIPEEHQKDYVWLYGNAKDNVIAAMNDIFEAVENGKYDQDDLHFEINSIQSAAQYLTYIANNLQK